MLKDNYYLNYSFITNEIEHNYGNNVHILSDPYLRTLLANICDQESKLIYVIEIIKNLTYHK